jgi:hypothetical protein
LSTDPQAAPLSGIEQQQHNVVLAQNPQLEQQSVVVVSEFDSSMVFSLERPYRIAQSTATTRLVESNNHPTKE